MRDLVWASEAWEDYLWWQTQGGSRPVGGPGGLGALGRVSLGV